MTQSGQREYFWIMHLEFPRTPSPMDVHPAFWIIEEFTAFRSGKITPPSGTTEEHVFDELVERCWNDVWGWYLEQNPGAKYQFGELFTQENRLPKPLVTFYRIVPNDPVW